jgi:hypothetical protein
LLLRLSEPIGWKYFYVSASREDIGESLGSAVPTTLPWAAFADLLVEGLSGMLVGLSIFVPPRAQYLADRLVESVSPKLVRLALDGNGHSLRIEWGTRVADDCLPEQVDCCVWYFGNRGETGVLIEDLHEICHTHKLVVAPQLEFAKL